MFTRDFTVVVATGSPAVQVKVAVVAATLDAASPAGGPAGGVVESATAPLYSAALNGHTVLYESLDVRFAWRTPDPATVPAWTVAEFPPLLVSWNAPAGVTFTIPQEIASLAPGVTKTPSG